MKHKRKLSAFFLTILFCVLICGYVQSVLATDAVNSIVSIENGKILREDGSVEYGRPEADEGDREPCVKEEPGQAQYYDRYMQKGTDSRISLMSVPDVRNLTTDIRKRTQWVDPSNGNGKVTLQYRSNSGMIQGTEDMNVILIQDKSGSMDANYGYNLEVVRRGWGTPDAVLWYPIQNSYGWSETVSDIATEENYMQRLLFKDADSGYPGYREGWMHNGEMSYNSPCQEDAHYYLLTETDPATGLPAWSMVQGNNLYNIAKTDLHHYQMISRDEARNQYLAEGRRVVRMTRGVYYDEKGEKNYPSEEQPAYFLDVTQMIKHGGKWILSTCAMQQCQTNDRLAKSQDFMNTLLTQIFAFNPDNQVAYIPFWGDVPKQGNWDNAHANGSADGLYIDNAGRMTRQEGVTEIGFTTDQKQLKDQIDHAFTYDGTNWAIAFQEALALLEGRSLEDAQKDTLIVFLTDGMPQGTVGTSLDSENPRINGENEIARLRKIPGVTIYACGVGVNQYDQTGLKQRMDQTDSTGTAAYARVTSDFEQLKKEIMDRIDRQYVIDIQGKDAFYTDQLSAPFSLDERKLSSGWKVLDGTGEEKKKGVPLEVYQAALHGAQYIYVRDSRTIYWHIGELTDGGYQETGHEMSFPICYGDYQNSTDGADKAMVSNEEQKLTYTTTQEPERILEQTMSAPSIIFNRQKKPDITVNKSIEGAVFEKDTKYRFVCTKEKETKEYVKDIAGETYLTVKAGETAGTARISDLEPGTYYIYEVDEMGRILSRQTGVAILTEKAAITTAEAGGSVPPSVQSSDAEILQNQDNVLRIQTEGASVLFQIEYIKVQVEKIWKDEDDPDRPKEAEIFLLRNGEKIQTMKLTEKAGWKGTFQNLEKYDAKGKMYQYTVEEKEITGYQSKIRQTGDYSYAIENTLLKGSVKIRKLDMDGKTPLAGAVFELQDKRGKRMEKKDTGENGEVLFADLAPGVYTITEIQTAKGHTLLKEPLTITIPLKMSEQEVEDKKVDKSQCVYAPEEKLYLFYDHTYEITNHASFQLPVTGGETPAGIYVMMAAGLAALAGAVWLARKKI